MAKAKKDGEFLHCYIKSSIMNDLNKFCEDTGFSKTVAVEKALTHYLEINKENEIKTLSETKSE